jgi:hypothetical protein
MKNLAALFAFAWTTSSAFQVIPTMHVGRRRVILHDTSVGRSMDKTRAQYCAENFGACTVDEMEEMRECEYTSFSVYPCFNMLVSITHSQCTALLFNE